MTADLYAIYGVSGFGREVMPLAREHVRRDGGDNGQLVFIDDATHGGQVNGHKVMNYDSFLGVEATNRFVAIAIADSSTRQKLAERLLADQVKLWDIIAQNVIIMDDTELGEGVILSPFVTITANVKIGKCFQANLYSYVAHDCQIGDYVTFAPNVKCNGNVTVEDHAYLATGAIIRQGKPGNPIVIGEGAIVGMGAVVTKSVPPGITVIGNPAAPLSKKNLRRNQ